MTGMEAGWYRDPAPPNPAFPTTVRYWDGAGWTDQVRAASRRERDAWHRDLAAAQAEQAAASAQAWEQAVANGTAAPEQLARVAAANQRHATPDGQALSGWWRRVAAVVIDSLVVGLVTTAVGWTWVTEIAHAYSVFFGLVGESVRTGATMPDSSVLATAVAGPMTTLALVAWSVQLVYNVGFLKAFAATPGKMVLGIEVRLRERPGVLSWGTVLARWLAQNIGALLALVPVVGALGSLYGLLDVLWPLWDGKRQALHDKVARTNVVRRAP